MPSIQDSQAQSSSVRQDAQRTHHETIVHASHHILLGDKSCAQTLETIVINKTTTSASHNQKRHHKQCSFTHVARFLWI